jgi:ABC-type Fe3+ transport system substrate-binding protein
MNAEDAAMQRRHFLQLMGAAFGPAVARAGTAAGPLTVLTGFPEAMVTRFEAAFRATHPNVDLRIMWRAGRDALDYLRGDGAAEVDVYWASSAHNFQALATEGRLIRMQTDRSDLPGTIGRQQQSDDEGRYTAAETAGYVIVTNESYLARHRLPVPTRFTDLEDPAYFGHIALPVPSRIGFAPAIYEHWLQVYGWERGFELLLNAAAGAHLHDRAGSSVVEQVGRSEAGVGLAMDFFAHNATAQGLDVSLLYPADTYFSAAHVGILTGARHPRSARIFVDYLLSSGGQKLLFDPAIGRLPVRASAYRHAPAGAFNPFSMAGTARGHDQGLGLRRQPVVSLLFDAAITDRHHELRELRQAILAAEHGRTVSASTLATVRALAYRTPIAEHEADSGLGALLSLPTTAASVRRASLRREWGQFFTTNYANAFAVLADGAA